MIKTAPGGATSDNHSHHRSGNVRGRASWCSNLAQWLPCPTRFTDVARYFSGGAPSRLFRGIVESAQKDLKQGTENHEQQERPG